jgi:predicted PurR-regulated permease PerM
MVGDGVSGLVRVADTTGTTWWVVSIAVGVAALGWVVVRRLDRWRERALAVGLTAVGAAVFVAVFSLL